MIPSEQLEMLKIFIDLCKSNPAMLHSPQLKFFKEYIEELGGNVGTPPPPRPAASEPQSQPTAAADEEEEPIVESDVDLDMEGIIPPHPDDGSPQVMGPESAVVDEDAIDKSNEKKREAVDHYAEGNYEEAAKAYTEAILLNPRSAMLYAKRGQVFLMQNKPQTCIADCDQAIKLNPDCAAAYKFRGRAYHLLADFLKAADDLRCACRLDFDEQADAWLKLVTPNARKLEEHKRKYDRLRSERKIRMHKKRQAQASAKAQPSASSFMPGNGAFQMPGNPMEILTELMQDPTLMASMQDPEVMAAISDISQNPMNFAKYMNNPKLAAVIEKLKSRFAGRQANSEAGDSQTPPPPPPADLDID